MRKLWREIKDQWFFIACAMIAIGGAVGLSACGADPSQREGALDSGVYVKDVPMPGGRSVTCVFFVPVGSDSGALSCDWVGHNKEQ